MGDVLERCVNVRCIACERSLVGVVADDSICRERADCGVRPILDMRAAIYAMRGAAQPEAAPRVPREEVEHMVKRLREHAQESFARSLHQYGILLNESALMIEDLYGPGCNMNRESI